MTYLKKTISGFFWTSALSGSIRVLAFAKIAVMARILLPSQFGEFAVVSMILAFLEIITETGINVFLIQEKDSLSRYLNTAWVVSILRGIVVCAVMIVASDPVAKFFNIPSVRPLIMLAGLIPFIRGFINPACVKFQKELFFSKEFWYRFSIVVIEIGLTLLFALSTKSAVSIVLGLMGSAVFEVAISWVFISPRPKANLNYFQVRTVLGRGKWVTGFGLFDYLFTTADNLVVGKLLGSSALGIYQNAYKLGILPSSQANDVYYKSMTPVFVKMSEENKDLKKAVLWGTGGVLLLHIVLGAVVYLKASDLVRIILGPNWLMAIPVVKIIAVMGAIRGIAYAPNSLLVGKLRQQYVTVVTAVAMLGLLVFIVPMTVRYGLVGAGYAATLGATLSLPVSIYYFTKVVRGES